MYAKTIESSDRLLVIRIQRFRIKDLGSNFCTLHTLEYSVNGGSTWKAPPGGDGSVTLGGGWPDNGGSEYSSAPDWSGDIHSFTFNTKHNDVKADFNGVDQSDVRIRFRVNDGLADILGIQEAEPIGDFVADPAGGIHKLVVFVPTDAVERVSNAVFTAGAGTMGSYSHCGFGTEGAGTFLPLEGARPAIGRKGKLKKVPETRFETIVPGDKLGAVVAAMKGIHPYEMPAFDVLKQCNPDCRLGLGRIGKLARPMRLRALVDKVKKATGA